MGLRPFFGARSGRRWAVWCFQGLHALSEGVILSFDPRRPCVFAYLFSSFPLFPQEFSAGQ